MKIMLIADKTMTDWKQVGRRGKVLHTVKESRDDDFPGLPAQTVSRSVLGSVKLCLTSDISAQEQLGVLPVL